MAALPPMALFCSTQRPASQVAPGSVTMEQVDIMPSDCCCLRLASACAWANALSFLPSLSLLDQAR
ncbi:hypothetical protein D3C72_2341680 [compost metagenome]